MHHIPDPKPVEQTSCISPRGVSSLLLTAIVFLGSASLEAQAPSLGKAVTFTVLGGSSVTNAGPSLLTGDLGVSPGTSITGFPPGILVGTIHANDPVAVQAQLDVTSAYNALAGATCNTDLTGKDLGSRTLPPGVYCFASSAQLTGTLTLDAGGNPNGVFIFQISSTLTTAPASAVTLINGASACNVYWQVGTSATLGSGTAFAGNVIASSSITMVSGASLSGRALARSGAVTLDTNKVTIPVTLATWSNFGVGWPGTTGVPSLTLSALPKIGTSVNVVVQNSYGPQTFGCFLCGFGAVNVPTPFGGALLVSPLACSFALPPIPTGGLVMQLSIPLDRALVCVSVDAQVLELDPGASHGVAFTRGLHIVIGL